MTRPRLLDLFCGAGGCARGYHLAGFDVAGVDLAPQPRYLLSGATRFIQTDALEYVREHGREYDAIHASPPCQAYTCLKSIRRFVGHKKYPLLVDPVRKILLSSGKPWVIENVPGSLGTHVILCGSMFGLGAWCSGQWHQLRRHREFDCSFFFLMSLTCQHVGRPVGVYGNGGANRRIKDTPGINGFTGTAAQRRSAMGIDWMNRYELSQAIPPAYTLYLGRQLLRHLEAQP